MHRVLIIDDEEKLRGLLARIISLEGFEVLQVGTIAIALKKLEQNEVDVILCDVKLPDGNGVDAVIKIKDKFPFTEIILLTAYGNIPDGVQAIKNGAFDYITKGDDNNKIVPLLHRAIEKKGLTKRVESLEKTLQSQYSFSKILGKSAAILKAKELAEKVAMQDTSVLLTGETGTGKEVFAQAIHHQSKRNKNNLVAVNCSAIGKDLLESELFGYKAGAFTGATKDKKGLLEEANHGTIFLDEIGEMPIDLQAKLLRVLETQEFYKVGDSKPCKVDIRFITATNRKLEKEIEMGRFRQDLFYRISVFQIELPALRERLADVELLAKHFLNLFAAKTNKRITHLHKDYVLALSKHNWQGNIRELKNIVERSVILCDGEELGSDTLPFDFQTNLQLGSDKSISAFDLASAEKIHIQKVLNYTGGNKTETAKLLNIALTTLYRKMADFQLS
ncbi:MAG: sigma-54-dependent Fis family transcriptional regulator [Bacteroidia bacterium]|nr:sigma-54-dependent Fis family transcriptional regulator [Bacteroidia bacterium]